MASWLVYSEDGQHLGPVPTEYVARAVKSGAIPANRWVTEVNRTAWRPLVEVPEIRAMLEGMSNPQRDREVTIIAMSDGFPSLPTPPSTLKEPPSSDEPGSSERTIIAPAAFEDEMAKLAEPPRPAAGLPAQDSDLDATQRQRAKNLGVAATEPEPFGATMRSPDGPPLVPRTSGNALLEPNTARAPAAAYRPSSASPPQLQKAPIVEAIVNPAPRAQTPLPRMTSTPSPEPRASRSSGGSGGSVLAFFLGGLALGAVVVVLMLVWAFRGGVLR